MYTVLLWLPFILEGGTDIYISQFSFYSWCLKNKHYMNDDNIEVIGAVVDDDDQDDAML